MTDRYSIWLELIIRASNYKCRFKCSLQAALMALKNLKHVSTLQLCTTAVHRGII